jgi:hypothetical protein
MAIAIETFLNPAKFTEELTSKLKDYRLPGIDLDAVVASQRNNVEALAHECRAAFEAHRPWPNDRPKSFKRP